MWMGPCMLALWNPCFDAWSRTFNSRSEILQYREKRKVSLGCIKRCCQCMKGGSSMLSQQMHSPICLLDPIAKALPDAAPHTSDVCSTFSLEVWVILCLQDPLRVYGVHGTSCTNNIFTAYYMFHVCLCESFSLYCETAACHIRKTETCWRWSCVQLTVCLISHQQWLSKSWSKHIKPATSLRPSLTKLLFDTGLCLTHEALSRDSDVT